MPNSPTVTKANPKVTTSNNQVFVARHRALYQYCLECGLISPGTPALFRRVSLREIKDKDVVGILSLELAAYTNTYTEIPLRCHVEPGLELDIEDIKLGASPARKYQIRKLS